jgi:hypothetical protein
MNQVVVNMKKKGHKEDALSIYHALLSWLVHAEVLTRYCQFLKSHFRSQSKNTLTPSNRLLMNRNRKKRRDLNQSMSAISTNNAPVLWLAMNHKREVMQHVSHFHDSERSKQFTASNKCPTFATFRYPSKILRRTILCAREIPKYKKMKFMEYEPPPPPGERWSSRWPRPEGTQRKQKYTSTHS